MKGLAAPVLADRVGERLAVAGRAVEVDEHHRVAAPGEGLRIPAPAPLVLEADLRATVHEEGDRILATRFETCGLHHVTVDRRIIGAGEAELLERCHRALPEHIGIDGGQTPRRDAGLRRDEQIGGRGQ